MLQFDHMSVSVYDEDSKCWNFVQYVSSVYKRKYFHFLYAHAHADTGLHFPIAIFLQGHFYLFYKSTLYFDDLRTDIDSRQ
jgi:hypothetical protein